MPKPVKESLNYLYSLVSKGIKPGLERISLICNLIGNPQDKFKSIIIGGTNGKGSTVTFLSSILRESGLKVGSYFSPHLEIFNERISVNGKLIPDNATAELVEIIRGKIEAYNADKSIVERLSPTFFEFVTAIAFEYFKLQNIDIAVLEIGLGGRWDAVNIATPLLSIITNISIDHTDYLGDSIEGIAGEKAGIIRNGAPVITGEESPQILKIFEDSARQAGSPIYIFGKDYKISKQAERLFSYSDKSEKIDSIAISLEGDHQFKNASAAVKAFDLLKNEFGFKLSRKNLIEGLKNAQIAGRLEEIKTRLPFKVILDGAHNIGGSLILSEYLRKKIAKEDLTLMIGIMKDKNYSGMISNYLDLAKKIILVIPSIQRAWDQSMIEEICSKDPQKFVVIPSIEKAVRYAQGNLTEKDTLCITGSLYTVGEAGSILKRLS